MKVALCAKMLEDSDGRCNGREPLTLRFDPACALVVSVTFEEASGEPVEWLIGRQILASGGGAPNGDVRAERDAKWLTLSLSSDDGSCRVALPIAELDDFLEQTYALVPLGEEITELDIDAAITDMLGSSW